MILKIFIQKDSNLTVTSIFALCILQYKLHTFCQLLKMLTPDKFGHLFTKIHGLREEILLHTFQWYKNTFTRGD